MSATMPFILQHHSRSGGVNNADYGLTLQALICDRYDLEVNAHAAEQFRSGFNADYVEELTPVCTKIFELVGSEPTKLLTYTREMTNAVQTTSPHNFLLENGKTLSIRTMKSSDKVAPRTVGQAGFPVLNDMFSDIYGKPIRDQQDVRNLIYNHIHEVMPIFIDHFFLSDYTVFVNRKNLNEISVIKSDEVGEYAFAKEDFTFTKALEDWTESITLKYKGASIAEIQTHLNRSFKFRFIVSAIPEWLQQVKETNETLGMTAEAAICDLFGLKKPASFATRVPAALERELMPVVKDAFKQLPKAIKHTGPMSGKRKGEKCPYDFLLEGDRTLSVKTNKREKVCPPEVGQPAADTCFLYFGQFLPPGETKITNQNFKQMVFDHIEDLIPIYIEHLFDSKWLLWIYQERGAYKYRIIPQEDVKSLPWQRERFSFTRPTVADWNESNTLKYDNVTIGEFQVHRHRSCFKFRFNMPVLIELICV